MCPLFNIVFQNIVASANIQGKIDLETVAVIIDNVMYEPELFLEVIYRMQDPKTVLLFASGKIVCTGAKSEEMVYESVTKTYDLLLEFDLLILGRFMTIPNEPSS